MSYYPDFAELLDRYLSAQERSGAWLAQRLGLNPATITRWRNGDSRPNRPELVIQVADLLGIYGEERERLLVAAGYGYIAAEPKPLDDANPTMPTSPLEVDSSSSKTKVENDSKEESKQSVLHRLLAAFWPFSLSKDTKSKANSHQITVPKELNLDLHDTSSRDLYRSDVDSNRVEEKSFHDIEQILARSVGIFGDVLSSTISEHSISQQQLAVFVNVSPAAVSQWRTGKRIPNAATLYRIGQAVGLNENERANLLQAWLTAGTIQNLLDYLNANEGNAHQEDVKKIFYQLGLE